MNIFCILNKTNGLEGINFVDTHFQLPHFHLTFQWKALVSERGSTLLEYIASDNLQSNLSHKAA